MKNYWWIFGGVILLWIAGLVLPPLISKGSLEAAGQSGDMFGSVNALFSALAFACLIIALRLQSNELSLQREELRLTREEFANQTQIHSAHLELLKSEREEREHQFRLQSEPYLMLRNTSHRDRHVVARLLNVGTPIFDIRVESFGAPKSGVRSCRIDPDTIISKESESMIWWSYEAGSAGILSHGTYEVVLSFKTGFDEDRKSVKLAVEFRG